MRARALQQPKRPVSVQRNVSRRVQPTRPPPTISKENQGMTAATIWVDADVSCGIELS